MRARFVNIDRDMPLLLPPDLHQWVPPDYLIHLIMDAVGNSISAGARFYERGTCETQYPAELLLVRLIHSYAQAAPRLKPAVVAIGISSDQFFGRLRTSPATILVSSTGRTGEHPASARRRREEWLEGRADSRSTSRPGR